MINPSTINKITDNNWLHASFKTIHNDLHYAHIRMFAENKNIFRSKAIEEHAGFFEAGNIVIIITYAYIFGKTVVSVSIETTKIMIAFINKSWYIFTIAFVEVWLIFV